MKTRLLIIIGIAIVFAGLLVELIPNSNAMCAANEDWDRAPCLDVIGNGKYIQKDVDRWAEYYSYKGSEVMEEKYLELNNAINENRLDDWISESHENLNVYQYYFFSGRAPNTGEYDGYFDTIKVYESDDADNKRNFLNIQPIFSFGPILILEELLIFVVIGTIIVLIVIWRKRK